MIGSTSLNIDHTPLAIWYHTLGFNQQYHLSQLESQRCGTNLTLMMGWMIVFNCRCVLRMRNLAINSDTIDCFGRTFFDEYDLN